MTDEQSIQQQLGKLAALRDAIAQVIVGHLHALIVGPSCRKFETIGTMREVLAICGPRDSAHRRRLKPLGRCFVLFE